MTTNSPGASVDFTRFSRMRTAAHKDQDATMQKVADEFEAMFAETMLKAARAAETGDGLLDSSETGTYRELLDGQLAQSLAQTQDFGFESMLKQQFAGVLKGLEKQQAAAEATSPSGRAALRMLSSVESPLPGGVPVTAPRAPDSIFGAPNARADAGDIDARKQAFLDEISPIAASAASDLGVAPRALMAQAALESGWGRHVIRMPDGSSSHNYFGIKASGDWRGATVRIPTTEYINGRAVTVQASFRAYPDAQSAFRDYVDFIGQNPRYREALAHGANAGQYARHLERAGYATDPNYANKIMAILSGDGFDGLADEGAGVSN
ncbi:MAG: flagellar assembly peptidoglycan hydrolase FlgJ [Gammaproteobacteria bacterium]